MFAKLRVKRRSLKMVLIDLHPYLIVLYGYCYWLVQKTLSVTAHTLVSSIELRLSLDKMLHIFYLTLTSQRGPP